MAAALVLIVAAEPASGQDKHLIDDLIPLTDPTDDWRTRLTPTGQPITIYGQISQALLAYDDGFVMKGYVPVDNSNASTRVGFLWQLYPLAGINWVARFEGGFTPRASNAVNQIDSSGDGFSFDGTHLRKLELIIDSKRFGTLSIGQGSTATDGIAEIDFSRTKVTAYSSVAQSAGGQHLRLSNGRFSSLIIGDVFNNFDGDNVTGYNSDGSRKLRLRYDTPELDGFKLSLAAGREVMDGGDNDLHLDAAIRYERKQGDFRIGVGLGHSVVGDEETTSGSVSVVHYPTGANLTFAAGRNSENGHYVYSKLGLIRSVFPAGNTAISIDWYVGRDIGGPGWHSESIGLAATQEFRSANVEAFGLIRSYDFDDAVFDYKDSIVLFTGLRWKF